MLRNKNKSRTTSQAPQVIKSSHTLADLQAALQNRPILTIDCQYQLLAHYNKNASAEQLAKVKEIFNSFSTFNEAIQYIKGYEEIEKEVQLEPHVILEKVFWLLGNGVFQEIIHHLSDSLKILLGGEYKADHQLIASTYYILAIAHFALANDAEGRYNFENGIYFDEDNTVLILQDLKKILYDFIKNYLDSIFDEYLSPFSVIDPVKYSLYLAKKNKRYSIVPTYQLFQHLLKQEEAFSHSKRFLSFTELNYLLWMSTCEFISDSNLITPTIKKALIAKKNKFLTNVTKDTINSERAVKLRSVFKLSAPYADVELHERLLRCILFIDDKRIYIENLSTSVSNNAQNIESEITAPSDVVYSDKASALGSLASATTGDQQYAHESQPVDMTAPAVASIEEKEILPVATPPVAEIEEKTLLSEAVEVQPETVPSTTSKSRNRKKHMPHRAKPINHNHSHSQRKKRVFTSYKEILASDANDTLLVDMPAMEGEPTLPLVSDVKRLDEKMPVVVATSSETIKEKSTLRFLSNNAAVTPIKETLSVPSRRTFHLFQPAAPKKYVKIQQDVSSSPCYDLASSHDFSTLPIANPPVQTKIEKLKQQLAERDSQVRSLTAGHTQQKADLKEKDHPIEKLKQQLAQKDQQLTERDSQVRSLTAGHTQQKADLKEQDHQIEKLKQQLAQKDQQLAERDSQISSLTAEHTQLKADLKEANKSKLMSEGTLQLASQKIDQLRQALTAQSSQLEDQFRELTHYSQEFLLQAKTIDMMGNQNNQMYLLLIQKTINELMNGINPILPIGVSALPPVAMTQTRQAFFQPTGVVMPQNDCIPQPDGSAYTLSRTSSQ